MIKTNLKPIYNTVWRVLVVFSVLLQASLMPLDFLFELRSMHWYRMLDLFISIIFFIDLIVNIFIYRNIKNNTRLKDIYWDSYSSWKFFISDIFSILPYALIFSNPYFQFFRLFKWIKVYRTVRFFQIRNIRMSTKISLWFLVSGFFLFSHWFTCIWLWIHGLESNFSNADNYVKALYWVITTLTSVGYGDIVPHGNIEMLFTILLQILGVGVLALLVGTMVGIYAKKNPTDQRFEENMERLRALIHYQKISKNLQQRISDYFTYEWKQKLGYDETELMETLPYGLRNELQLEFKKNAIKDIPLFDCVNDHFIRDIAQYLTPMVLTPGDYLFRKGDIAHSMFFIQRGKFKVLSENEELTILKAGDFMGEIALFKKSNRTATVKSEGYSDVYELQKKEFEKVLKKYPQIAEKISAKSKLREKRYI